MKTKLALLLMVISLLVTSGCSKFDKKEELKLGQYTMQNSQGEDWAWVILKEENKFEFNRNMATSYDPMGTYSIKDHRLVLKADLSEIYIFEIDGDKLIFSSGDGAKGLLEEGAVFKLMKEK